MKSFRVNIILRIALLSATIFGFVYLILETEMVASIIFLGLLICVEIFSLIRFVEVTNRELSRFFSAFANSDFSQTFSKKTLGKSFSELEQAFNEVMKKFQQTRKEKEEHHRFLQTIVQHVGVGLLSFDRDGNIEFINQTAKRIFGHSQIKNVRVLNNINPGLGDTVLKLRTQNKAVLKIFRENELVQALAYSTVIKLHGKEFTLTALQNIQSELEEKELEAWQNLIKVLTHEIMNSITPISSLASTMRELLNDETEFRGGDMRLAVETIEKRSSGLIHFVENYRSLTHIKKPDFRIFALSELFENVRTITDSELKEKNINFVTSITPENLELTADIALIEQVIINLINNSSVWLSETQNPKIELKAFLSKSGRVTITIEDNGAGIKQKDLEKIFIPFFTTKPDGSGIGLSLSRQIMRAHNGNIFAESVPGVKTMFVLKF